MTDAQWHGFGHVMSLVENLVQMAALVWLSIRLHQEKRRK